MSMVVDENKASRQFNLKSYIEALKANGLIVPAVVTNLTFDDDSTVPKLFFTPVRPLTEPEFRQVEGRINDPAVRDMLDDIDLKSEEGKPVNQLLHAPAPVAAAPVVPPVTVAPAAPAAPVSGQRRGRPPKAETAPAPAPAVEAAPAGFPTAAAAPAPVQAAAPAAPAAPAGVPGFTVNLDEFDA
jgi:hypothetical protein